MRNLTKIVASAALAATLPVLASSSDAATVRRHLTCSVGSTITLPNLPLVGSISSTPFVITNKWAMTIPANTTYTMRLDRKVWTVKYKNALGQGESFAVNSPAASGQCDVSVPG